MNKLYSTFVFVVSLSCFTSCQNTTKNKGWMTIQPGYSYHITATDLPKDDVFRIVKITTQQDNHIEVVPNDSEVNYLNLFVDTNPAVTKWMNELPKGISGQLRLDVDATTKEIMGEIAIRVILPEHYDTSHLTSDTSWLAQQPFCKSIEYISKEKAREAFIKNGGEDFREFLDSNLLPISLDFYLTPAYAGTGKKALVEKAIYGHFKEIENIAFPLIGNNPTYLKMQVLLFDFRK